MEDFRNTEEDQSSPVSQKDDKRILEESPTPAHLNCVTLRSSSTPSLSPAPAPVGPALPPAGENNAKQTTVSNGQVPPSVWRTSREVPPRFRHHQEPKILLKRGQSLDGISPFLHTGDESNANTTQRSASLTYANSTCGLGAEAPPLSQGMDRIVVDCSDLQAWTSDAASRRQNESLNKSSWECNQGMQKNPESALPPSSGTPLNSADSDCVSQKTQSPVEGQGERRMELEVGPKQAEADPADDCKGFSSNLEALIPDICNSRPSGELLETEEMWGAYGESQVRRKITGNNGVCHEISQRAWDEERDGLKKQAATIKLSDVPKEVTSGQVKESLPDCLPDTQMTATSTTTTNREKGVNERTWEGSECQSVGHRNSEDPRAQTSCTEVTLQSMLSRSDLDPRVFSNTGWGQTQIKQSVAWDLAVDSSSESGRDWTERAQIDLNSPRCPQWSSDLQDQVKEARSQGARCKGEQNEQKTDKKQAALLPGRGNSWVEVVEDEQGIRWDGNRKDSEKQREGDHGSWGLGDNQWGENKGRAGQGEKSWANAEDEGRKSKQHQGWGDSRHPQHIPNNQTAPKEPQQKCSARKPSSIPHVASNIEPSGWEEPSPQSISRKMEIDDGTSAWGDPAHYGKKSVNMWDKSNLQQSQPSQQHESVPDTNLTSRDKNTAWEQRVGVPEQLMDSSTAGWGKAGDARSGWMHQEESGKGAGLVGSCAKPAKSGSKTMQDGWGDEGSNTLRHSSWEEEDTGSSMWGSMGQDSTSSFSSGGWNQSQGGRRTRAKGSLRGDGGGSWTGLITRQMSNMGITDEETISASDRSRRWMNDFNGDMRRGGRGGGGFRSHGSKESGVAGVFNAPGVGHLRNVQQPGVHHINPSPGIRAQVPQAFLTPQVSGSVLNPMFPPQLSPQQLAMLSGIHPHVQQVQLAHQLLMQQQQQQQQQQHSLSHRKFSHAPPPPPHPPLYHHHQDPQQLARIMALLQQRPKTPTSFPGLLPGPVKLRGDSSYLHCDLVGVENMGVASPDLIDNWYQKPGGKLSSAHNNPIWPPEFQPGVPWKGVQSPEPDPNPYSGMLGENTLTDTEHHLLQDNTVSLSEMNTILPSPGAWPYCASDTHNPVKFPALATSWPPEPIGPRTNRNSSQLPRPPPGLTHQKQSPWLGVGRHMSREWGSERQSHELPHVTESSWSAGASTGSSWLLLRNLTPQIDSSTLKTICLQHGPLMTFNLGIAHGSALIRYCSPEEAVKAQSALHMCVLGNTTVLAEFVSEEDVARYFTHSQSRETDGDREIDVDTESETGGGEEVKLCWENLDGVGLSLSNQWSHSQGTGVWGGVPSGYHGSSLWGSPQVEDRGPGLLDGNLLGGGSDTL